MPRQPFTRALITGASSGIGHAMARELARRGVGVVLVARRRDHLEQFAEVARRDHGVHVEVLAADLLEEAGLARVEDRLRADPPIDLLVNNAGMEFHGRFHELPVEGEEAQVLLNVRAVVRLTHAALGVMVPRGRGGVLMTSSMAGFQPLPQLATYSASKAFVTSFAQSLHEELRGTGVTTTALCPGFVDTGFVEGAGVPRAMLMDAEAVARAGIDAVVAGRAVVTPGLSGKVIAAMSQLTPTPVTRRFLGETVRRLR